MLTIDRWKTKFGGQLMVQAYIFSILAAVYIAAATRPADGSAEPPAAPDTNPPGKTPWTASPSSP